MELYRKLVYKYTDLCGNFSSEIQTYCGISKRGQKKERSDEDLLYDFLETMNT